MSFRELLRKEFSPYRDLSPDQLRLLEDHFRLLTAWNARLNLTRIQGLEDTVIRHYCESLFLGSWIPGGAWRIADVGAGAGFPGIPVAILRPECSVTLVESHQRKAVFLREAVRGLTNVSVESARAEDLRMQFDWIVSRAVDPQEVAALTFAARKALLIGVEDSQKLGWESIKLPWGQERVVAFHVEQPGT